MPRIPKTEAERIALFETIIAGMKANPELYKDSPVKVEEFETALDALKAKRDEAIASQAATDEIFDEKAEMMLAQINKSERIFDYAEAKTNYDDNELKKIGWGAPSKTASELPGQTRTLEILKQDGDKIKLDWKNPSEGGRVRFYNVEMQMPDGKWTLKKTVIESEAELEDLPRKQELAFRVVSVNAAGEGVPSNTVTATL